MNKYSLLSMKDLTKQDIIQILDDALLFSDKYKDWQLPCSKALVANLFFEASTRTHYSFESAELQLGCKPADIDVGKSSITKGETLYDTVKVLESIGYDAVVIRHSQDAYYRELENINIPILNAGDGQGDHPTQCLLDLLTMYQEFGHLEGLKVVICGDILHSRVAASDKEALEKMGAEVCFAGPEIWRREGFKAVELDDVIEDADVVMMLRIQKERGSALTDVSDEEYLERYGMNKTRYNKMKDTAIIMHPGPINRGVEFDTDLVEAPKSRYFKQIQNGVLVRKAVIKRAFGFAPFDKEDAQ
ncbi:MAG: aspartate carbamoyltransferase catalytic subunit [Solobacterium sp.]|nr:aspartate carbamoyltransferase catalytic subunit [Solobacterium sp.]